MLPRKPAHVNSKTGVALFPACWAGGWGIISRMLIGQRRKTYREFAMWIVPGRRSVLTSTLWNRHYSRLGSRHLCWGPRPGSAGFAANSWHLLPASETCPQTAGAVLPKRQRARGAWKSKSTPPPLQWPDCWEGTEAWIPFLKRGRTQGCNLYSRAPQRIRQKLGLPLKSNPQTAASPTYPAYLLLS